jgi:signal transduction histidine kinase
MSSGRRGVAGRGDGLTIVHAIAKAHDGAAHAANLAGGGADAWIAIPSDAARTDDGQKPAIADRV